MAQHDQNIANDTGAAVRTDINNALAAIFGNSSGASTPATTVAYQLWADTTNALMKQRNAANSAWIVVGRLDGEAFGLQAQGSNIASAGTLDLDAATGNLVDVTGTTTITAITLTQGRWRWVRFTGALVLTNGASLVLPGGVNITTAAGDFALVYGYAAGVVRIATFIPAARVVSGTRVATQFDKTSDTTLANVTGLTANVAAGGVYKFRAHLMTSAGGGGGVKAAIAGTATATSIGYTGMAFNGTAIGASLNATALASAVAAVTAVVSIMTIEGTIVVNAAGTLTVQFAQNASDGTASSVLVDSSFHVERIA